MSLSLKFAMRELRSGIKGFGIFLACLALGVAALAAAGSTAEAFREALALQGRDILGGDLAVSVNGRQFSDDELNAFRKLGLMSNRLHLRAMAESVNFDGSRRLVEVSAVDKAYPLSGTVSLEGAHNLAEATASQGGINGAAVAPELLDRLKLKLGDMFLIGDTRFRIRATIVHEPDTLGRGFPLGPRVIVSRDALLRSGMVHSDDLFGEVATIVLKSASTEAKAMTALKTEFPNSGLTIKDRANAVSGLGRLIDQLDFFLSFIGLSALFTGGIGVSSAVSSYLAQRRQAIAILKATGASGALIRNIYLIQIGAIAILGVTLGILAGMLVPICLGWMLGNKLPIPVLFAIYPLPLVKAGAFGLAAAAAFSLGPIARARTTSPAALLRQTLSARLAFGWEIVGIVIAATLIAVLSAFTAPSPLIAMIMLLGLGVAMACLFGLGQGVTYLAGILRNFFRGAVRIGIANLAGPKSAARTASPSMGFGIAILTMIILIQSSLMAQVDLAAGRTAPSMVFTQIAPEDGADFDRLATQALGPLSPAIYRRYPFATGRITAIDGAPVDVSKLDPKVRWAFDQDATLSTQDTQPADVKLTKGRWWPSHYLGEPQVILADEIADGAKIAVGEHITLSVLGRDLDVTVAATRKIDFGQFGDNFPIVLNPAALEGANLRDIVIIRSTKAQDDSLTDAVGHRFPEVNIISVREQLDAAAAIFSQIGMAIQVAAGVTLAASLLVLVGAIAANAQARSSEAAILKVLGASRRFVIATYCVEYGAVGLSAGVTGIALGAMAAYPIVSLGLHAPFRGDWFAVFMALVIVVSVGTFFGGIAAIVALSRRPAGALSPE